MAERLTNLRMQAFRGIRDQFGLELPGGRSAVFLGENGTGKSTIADALEWFFTGRIDFLAREGREGGLRHAGAPPDLTTVVEVETTGDLGGRIEYGSGSSRSAATCRTRENFILRGRTLARFIDLTKGEKWRELAEILGLAPVERLRVDLQRARNELRAALRERRQAQQGRDQALRTLSVEPTGAGVLAAFREGGARAGIAPPASLAEAVGDQWLQAIAPLDDAQDRERQLAGVIGDLKAAQAIAISREAVTAWNDYITSSDTPSRLRLNLLGAAQAVLDAEGPLDRCPLCAQEVDPSSLAQVVTDALRTLRISAEDLQAVREGVRILVRDLRSGHRRRQDLRTTAQALGIDLRALSTCPAADLEACAEQGSPVDAAALNSYLRDLTDWDSRASHILAESATPARPDDGRQALVDVAILHREARAWKRATDSAAAAARASSLADMVFAAYQQRFRQYVDDVLGQITDRVAELYGQLHPEGGFDAVSVETWRDTGVELAVNFHGTKQKPPHRVLSESHLNSLGVVLFLAMAEAFNESIDFLILDDVVNSFDAGHRGELACLLTDQFADLQLIVLTHDPQFFVRLTRRAPSWDRHEFTSWRYEDGPRTRKSQSDRLVGQARERLHADDVSGAAQGARVALEELLQEACEVLGGKVPFRRGFTNDHREVSEVMAGLRSCLKDRPLRAHYDVAKPLLDDLEADVQAALNPESHAGGGTTSRNEVRAALERVEELRDLWTCHSCRTRTWHRKTVGGLRCSCQATPFPPSVAMPSHV